MSKSMIKVMATLAVTTSCAAYISDWCDVQKNKSDVSKIHVTKIKNISEETKNYLCYLMKKWPGTTNKKDLKKIKSSIEQFDINIFNKLGEYKPAVVISITTAILTDLQANLKSNRKVWLDKAVKNFAVIYDMFDETIMESSEVVNDLNTVLHAWDVFLKNS